MRGVHAVKRILGIRNGFRKPVKHLVVRNELVRILQRDPVNNRKLLSEQFSHSQLIGCRQKKRLEKDNYYSLLFQLFDKLFQIILNSL